MCDGTKHDGCCDGSLKGERGGPKVTSASGEMAVELSLAR